MMSRIFIAAALTSGVLFASAPTKTVDTQHEIDPQSLCGKGSTEKPLAVSLEAGGRVLGFVFCLDDKHKNGHSVKLTEDPRTWDVRIANIYDLGAVEDADSPVNPDRQPPAVQVQK